MVNQSVRPHGSLPDTSSKSTYQNLGVKHFVLDTMDKCLAHLKAEGLEPPRSKFFKKIKILFQYNSKLRH